MISSSRTPSDPIGRSQRPVYPLLAMLFGMMVTSCGTDPPTEPLNLVVVMVDTLRADHLGAYGYHRDTSPNLDRFAQENILFSSARSQAPCTFPSVNSLFTSRSPHNFLGQPEKRVGIPAGFPTLASILRDDGYWTAAVSASPIVRKTPSRNNPEGGFGHGFELFNEKCNRFRDAACVNKVAFRALGRRPEAKPFLLYLHYMDPHDLYRPPDSWERRFAADGPWRDFIANGDPRPIAQAIYRGMEDPRASRAEIEHLVDLYDEEIRYFDDQFQKLLDRLESLGLSETTMVIVIADHGEEFLEHDHVKHCKTLHDTQIRTPLFMRIPGTLGPREVPTHVENLDVLPTVLDYLGIDSGDLGLEGHSLTPLIEGEDRPDSTSLSSWKDGHALVVDRYKLISDPRHEAMHLFDLAVDPGETVELWGNRPDLESRLLERLRERVRESGNPEEGLDQTEAQLRALGYLE